MSAVEMGIALKGSHGHEDEINQYERKLVQVIFLHLAYFFTIIGNTGSNLVFLFYSIFYLTNKDEDLKIALSHS